MSVEKFTYTRSVTLISSFLVDAFYDDESRTLLVRMESSLPGGYIYYNVPPGVWMDFTGADSAGVYYDFNIKGVYDSFKVGSVNIEPSTSVTSWLNVGRKEESDKQDAHPSFPSWLVTLDIPGFVDETFFMPFIGDFNELGESLAGAMAELGIMEYTVAGVNKVE